MGSKFPTNPDLVLTFITNILSFINESQIKIPKMYGNPRSHKTSKMGSKCVYAVGDKSIKFYHKVLTTFVAKSPMWSFLFWNLKPLASNPQQKTFENSNAVL